MRPPCRNGGSRPRYHASSVAAHLVVTISAETLAGHDDLPGELTGYGAITAQAARDIAQQAGTADLVTLDRQHHRSPRAPSHLSAPRPPGRRTRRWRSFGPPAHTGYRPSNDVVRDVIATHRTCRFPGCRRPGEQCDLDHLIAYGQGGPTCPCNLIPLFRHHHKLKTHAGWQVDHLGSEIMGTLQWISPAGFHYTVPPADHPGRTDPGASPDPPPGHA